MTDRITLGLAGPDMDQLSREYISPATKDERFVLAMVSGSWEALQAALQENEPALLVLYADIAPGPEALHGLLSRLKRAVAVLLLPASWTNFTGLLESAHTVRKVYPLPAMPAEVLKFGYSAALTEAVKERSAAPLAARPENPTSSQAAVGTRLIAFVSAQGGVGRSTLAEALGFELAARRSIRALLFSFDLPSCAPLRLGTRFAPSAAEFLQRSEGGFPDAIQTTPDGLDLVIAPPESTAYAAAAREEGRARLHDLVTEAYKHHYAAILLDLPCGESSWMLQPLRAAGTLVLLSRPTTEGVRAVGHLIKLLTQVVGSQHRFSRDAFFLVLNQRTPKSIYTATAFTSEVAKYAGWSPPVLASIDYDPLIPRAQDDGRPAASASESLGRAAAALVDSFYGASRGEQPLRRGLRLGPVRIRTTG